MGSPIVFCAPDSVVHLLREGNTLLDQPRDGFAIDGNLVALEPFRVRHLRDVWAREAAAVGIVSNAASNDGQKMWSPVVPEAIVHHAQRASSVFVVMCEPSGVEEFDHRRTRRGPHPQKRSQTVPVNAHHDLGSTDPGLE